MRLNQTATYVITEKQAKDILKKKPKDMTKQEYLCKIINDSYGIYGTVTHVRIV